VNALAKTGSLRRPLRHRAALQEEDGPWCPKKVVAHMNEFTIVSNEAEFESWLIAALQHERQRLFGTAQYRRTVTAPKKPTASPKTGPLIERSDLVSESSC
jgi:hypothetical protein